MTASASYLSPAARLTSPSSLPTAPSIPAAKSASPHARPPPAPLLSLVTSHLLASLNVCGQHLLTLSTTCLLFLHTHFSRLLTRLTSHNAGYVLWSGVLAVLPVPLTAGAEYAVPFPFAGSANPEERELSDLSYAMSLYNPLALRRRRKHTVRAPPYAVLAKLVLDLDETLVHTTDVEIPVYDCRVNIHTRRLSRTFYILKRPHLDTFLLTLAPYYHICVFTASIRRYADAVLDLVDTRGCVQQRLYRSHCTRDDAGQLVKDLAVLGRGRKRVVLVDNSPVAYSRNEDNAVPISTWYDEQGDTELRSLIPLLLALRNVDDVRTVLGRRRLIMQSTAAGG